MKTEKELIDQIRAKFMRHHPDLLLGIGDDAGLVRNVAGQVWAITSDMLVEDVHFSLAFTDTRRLGKKALAVNLSDLAAMGADPTFALLCLAIPTRLKPTKIDPLLEGIAELADAFGVVLIGGDVSASPEKLVLNITALGKCGFGRALRRDGAKPGDHLFVSGRLGASRAGLELLRRGQRVSTARTEASRQLILAHLEPVPRVALGRVLSEHRLASAAIDISDGLSTDLTHLCDESAVGAILNAASIPVAEVDQESKLPTLEMALHGGEDYELLFTVSPEDLDAIQSLTAPFSVTEIGMINDQAGALFLESDGRLQPLAPGGFDHFKP